MGFTRTLVILLIGVVIPLVVIVTVLIGHTRSTPMSPLQVTRDAIDGARLWLALARKLAANGAAEAARLPSVYCLLCCDLHDRLCWLSCHRCLFGLGRGSITRRAVLSAPPRAARRDQIWRSAP